MSRLTLLYRLILRPLFRQPGRSLLILFAVALGTAAVIAIDLASDAAAGSFHSSIEALSGSNDFEVTAAGGVPEQIVAQLTRLPYALRIAPRIEDHATIAATRDTVPLIGIDLIAAASEHSPQLSIEQHDTLDGINDPNAIFVTVGLHKNIGDTIELLINDQRKAFTVRGILPDASQAAGNAILMDIAAAQLATNKLGRVDRILIKLPRPDDPDLWRTRLRQALPAGVMLNPQGSATAANRRMLAAFRWNLRILSYIALLVGAFLIYNALSVSVIRRRAQIGTIRALGAGANSVLIAFLMEATLFGIAGSLAALPLGRLLASAAVRMLSTTVNALYVSSRPGAMHLSAISVLFAFLVGIGVAVISAIAPALEASRVPPTEAMAQGRREFEVRVHRRRDALFAILLAAVGTAAAQLPEIAGKPLMGYAAALLFVAAAALFAPITIHAAMKATANLLRKLLGVEALLASRSLAGSLRRTSVLVGALATAIAMIAAVGIMVGSFRTTVVNWMDNELPADLYIRPAANFGADQHPTIAPSVSATIASLPGVQHVSLFRAYEIEFQGLPATLAGADPNLSRSQQSLTFLSGRSTNDVLRQLASDDNAIISEPFANKHHMRAGDTLTLALGPRQVTFHVLGVFYDYGHEAGFILLDRSTLLRYLPDPAPSNLAVYLAPSANIDRTRAAIRQALPASNLLIFSNREIRREAIRVFDQTFTITYALEAVSILVAIGGIVGALISIVIDRRRELGVLRFLGATAAQIRRLILVEAALLGLLAQLIGLALGYVLSLILIYVINKQSFGWTIQFHWPIAVLLASMSVVYLATVLAGLYPARLAVRLNPIEVIHEE